MAKYQVGFIGCGNMGGPLVTAIARIIDSKDVAVCGKTRVRADKFAEEFGIVSTSKEDIITNSKWIFLGVKPQVLPEVLGEISPVLKKRNESDRFILVSMAAGIKIESIEEMLGAKYPIIRIMPNLPVSIGCGMTTYTLNDKVSASDIAEFSNVMQYSGELAAIDESLMDAGCSVAGCGPAFVYTFIKGLAEGGVRCGLSESQALDFAIQTCIGSAELIKINGEEPDILIDKVCSPGGSTIEGVKKLRELDLEDVVAKAVEASYKRNVELGKKK